RHPRGWVGWATESRPESVVTALACFASAPGDYTTAVGRAVLLGGDTDTIAAMTGVLSGALLGVQAIPLRVLAALEDHPGTRGRTYRAERGGRLFARRGANPVAPFSSAP